MKKMLCLLICVCMLMITGCAGASTELNILIRNKETADEEINTTITDADLVAEFDNVCSSLDNPLDDKYATAFFDSIETKHNSLYFSCTDFDAAVIADVDFVFRRQVPSITVFSCDYRRIPSNDND